MCGSDIDEQPAMPTGALRALHDDIAQFRKLAYSEEKQSAKYFSLLRSQVVQMYTPGKAWCIIWWT